MPLRALLFSLGAATMALGCAPAVHQIHAPPMAPAARPEASAQARSALLRGRVARETGDSAYATEALAQAAALDRGSQWLQAVNAEALLGIDGTPGSDLGEAEPVLRERLRLAPEDADAQAALVDLLLVERRGPEATAVVGGWDLVSLHLPDGLAARGMARLRTHDATGAMIDLGAALRVGGPAPVLLDRYVEAALAAGDSVTGSEVLSQVEAVWGSPPLLVTAKARLDATMPREAR